MGLHHDFVLVGAEEYGLRGYEPYICSTGRLRIHDDVASYLWDTLRWVPTRNPALRPPTTGMGLQYFGVTEISGEGARVLQAVVSRWADLFEVGPPELDLTTSYSLPPDGEPGPGRWEHARLDRDAVVADLRTLAGMAARAAGEGWVLLHIGI